MTHALGGIRKVVNMTIRFYRGNDHEVRFRIKDFDVELENIILTVENIYGDTKIVKKLNDGIKNIDGWYHVYFVPSDTKNIRYEKMTYKIDIVLDGLTYTIKKGKFIIK